MAAHYTAVDNNDRGRYSTLMSITVPSKNSGGIRLEILSGKALYLAAVEVYLVYVLYLYLPNMTWR